MIERRGERGDAESRHAAIRWFHADNAAERGRLPDRSAGIGSERAECGVAGDGSRGTAARAARDTREVPRIAGGFDARILRGRTHREFIHVCFAERDRARRAQFANYGRIVRRMVALENLRSACAWPARDINDVLDRDWHAAQWKLDVRFFGFPGRSFEIDREIGADFWLDFIDARPERFKRFTWRNFAATEQMLQIGDGERRQIGPAHSTTLVTTKRLLAFLGALLNACSAVKQSRGSSSRNTLNTGIA